MCIFPLGRKWIVILLDPFDVQERVVQASIWIFETVDTTLILYFTNMSFLQMKIRHYKTAHSLHVHCKSCQKWSKRGKVRRTMCHELQLVFFFRWGKSMVSNLSCIGYCLNLINETQRITINQLLIENKNTISGIHKFNVYNNFSFSRCRIYVISL